MQSQSMARVAKQPHSNFSSVDLKATVKCKRNRDIDAEDFVCKGEH